MFRTPNIFKACYPHIGSHQRKDKNPIEESEDSYQRYRNCRRITASVTKDRVNNGTYSRVREKEKEKKIRYVLFLADNALPFSQSTAEVTRQRSR